MEDDFTTVSKELDLFAEAKEVISLMKQLNGEDDGDVLETPQSITSKVEDILDNYQEQPHLLDSQLETMVSILLDTVKNNIKEESKQAEVDAAFKLLYMLTKVRGYKTVLKRFSHQSTDLILVLELVEAEDPSILTRWKHRYVLLLWLSLISLLPFNISVFDEQDSSGGAIVGRVLAVCQKYLATSDKASDGAAQVAARFFTRPDIANAQHLGTYIDWALGLFDTSEDLNRDPLVVGSLSSLAAMFKIAKRDHLLTFALRVIDVIQKHNLMHNENTLVRKLSAKLIQRVGLTFLPPRVAKWRYNRGSRSLTHNLKKSNTSTERDEADENRNNEEDAEDEYTIPEEIEVIVDILLTGIGDKDTVVRWSSAKGVGRITGRLPQELADEVVESLLEKLNVYEPDSAWHGACLALAELARRGLLLPTRLEQVMPLVYEALAYDVLNGSCSVGTHVRDAACYVCWAFARAYDPTVLDAFVIEMATNLIITSVFDREINVRRAASAALQENVGRLGTVPHGISIITIADYFALGNKRNAYLDISYFIAQYEEYRPALVQHLAEVKLVHWDSDIRRLSAQTLEKLASIARDDIVSALKGKIMADYLSKDLNTRQGCVRGLGSMVCGIGKSFEDEMAENEGLVDHSKRFFNVLGEDTIVSIHKLVHQITTNENLKGLGGTMVKRAVLFCLKKLARAAFPLLTSTPMTFEDEEYDAFAHILKFLISALHDVDDECRDEAVQALVALITSYSTSTKERRTYFHNTLLPQLVQILGTSSAQMILARSSVASCLGQLSANVLGGDVATVLDVLFKSAKAKDGESNRMIDLRAASINASAAIATTALILAEDIDEEARCALCVAVVEELLQGLNDYTITSRGDVGSIVRLASIRGLNISILTFLRHIPNFSSHANLLQRCVCELVKQLMEKLDKVRVESGRTLRVIVEELFNASSRAGGEEREEIPGSMKQLQETIASLQELLFKDMSPHFDWSAAHVTFPLLIPTLSITALRSFTLQGLTSSVGGLTGSLVRSSSKAVIDYLFTMNDAQKASVILDLVQILEDNINDDLILIPTLKTCDLLISSGCVDSLSSSNMEEFAAKLALAVKQLLRKCSNVSKIVQCVHVHCGLLNFSSSFETSMSSLTLALCHKYPRVRRATAEAVYVAFLGLDIPRVSREDALSVVDVVANTVWDGDIKLAREKRNSICDMLGLPKPKVKATTAKPQMPKNEFDSYKDLVDRAGY
eukprot:m.138335 g.138335  ORF g.138335 m.138335 type:complete len:1230 (-) comp14085_c0_seq1:53-3742(-)